MPSSQRSAAPGTHSKHINNESQRSRNASIGTIKTNRDVGLEAIRGVAALVVVAHHCLLGFYPEHSGSYPQDWPNGDQFTQHAWFALFNGPGAVVVFFTLSGYVLTRRYFLTGDINEVVRGALKRWPRLLGPALLSVLFSWLLFSTGAYHHLEIAQITRSEWMRMFAYGVISTDFRPNFLEALYQGSAGTFFEGTYSYNSSLWTMKYELAGSFTVFGFALIVSDVHVPFAKIWRDGLQRVGATDCKSVDQRVANL